MLQVYNDTTIKQADWEVLELVQVTAQYVDRVSGRVPGPAQHPPGGVPPQPRPPV